LAQPAERILNRRSLSDLVIHGICSNRIWIFIGVLAPFFDNIADQAGRWFASIGFDIKDLFSLQSHSLWQVGLYAFSMAMVVMIVVVSFSVIGSLISFYGYTLTTLDDRYIRRSGLFTKHEVSMRLSRLQMIVRQQDWLDRLLKRINLKFEQSNDNLNQAAPSAQSSKIIVPSINAEQCEQLIRELYPDNQLSNIKFEPISKHFLLRYIGYYLLPLWLICTTIALQNNEARLALLFSLVLFGVTALIVLRWKRWGYAHDQGYVYIRKGLIGVDYFCFPAYKVQQTQFNQSLLMKRRQLASLKLILASGSVTVPLIDEDCAYQLLNKCLYKVESSQQSWM
jgi:putative membrane protein